MDTNKKKELFRTLKYALVAASAGIIQIGTFTLMNEVFKWHYWVSYLISLLLSVTWNFTINRKYTFKSASNIPVAMLLVLAYYAVFTPLSTLLENYLTSEGVGVNEYLVTAINMVINFVTEFLYQRFVVFRKSIDSNEKESGETNPQTNADGFDALNPNGQLTDDEKTANHDDEVAILPLVDDEYPVETQKKD